MLHEDLNKIRIATLEEWKNTRFEHLELEQKEKDVISAAGTFFYQIFPASAYNSIQEG